MILPYERLGAMWLESGGFKARTFKTKHGDQHYYDFCGTGPRPPLVALHGLSSGAVPLAPIMRRLRRNYRRILLPDLLGHGLSATPEPCHTRALYDGLEEWLDATLDEPCILFGHSMGGGFALHYALRRPESVRGLVLLSPAGAPIASDHFKAWVSQFDLTTSESAMRFVTKLYSRLPWYAPIVAYECRRLFRRRAIIELVRSFEPDDAAIPEQLQHLTIPIRLIWGGREATLRDEQLAFFKAHLPGHVEFIEPPHFTHCPYLEYPGEVTDLIEGFSVASSRLTEP